LGNNQGNFQLHSYNIVKSFREATFLTHTVHHLCM